jgi:hypothetical protein
MARNPGALVRLILVSCLLLAPSSLLQADGGAVRLRERAGDYQIAVFTSPTPFRAGPVDVSVLVQDAASGECEPEARVTVRLTGAGAGQAAVFQLPESGWWEVEVAVDGSHGPARVRFEVEAGERPPRWLDLWPWFAWPALAVALFGIHQVLVWRKVR